MGHKIAGNHELAQRLCRALDLDPSKVARINLKIHHDDIVHADVKLLVEDDQLENIIMELEYCKFVEKDENAG